MADQTDHPDTRMSGPGIYITGDPTPFQPLTSADLQAEYAAAQIAWKKPRLSGGHTIMDKFGTGPVGAQGTTAHGIYGTSASTGTGNLNPGGGPSGGGSSGAGFIPSGGTAAQQDAYATLKGLLDQYGLGSLASWAWSELLNNRSANEIALSLLEQPAYKQRFGAVIDARRAAGLPPVSAAEIVSYEGSWNSIARAGGLPDSFGGRDVAQQLLAQNVSVAEASERVQRGFIQVQQAPIEVRAAFDSFFGAQSDSALAAMFIDDSLALPELEKRVAEAQAAGSATMHGFNLDQSLARRLADAGVSFAEAQSGFGVLAEHRSLFDESISENTDLTTQQGVEGQFGLSSASAEAVQRRSEARRAAYSGSGSVAESQSGLYGAGSARQT